MDSFLWTLLIVNSLLKYLVPVLIVMDAFVNIGLSDLVVVGPGPIFISAIYNDMIMSTRLQAVSVCR